MSIVLQSKFLLLINYYYSSKHYFYPKISTFLLKHLSLCLGPSLDSIFLNPWCVLSSFYNLGGPIWSRHFSFSKFSTTLLSLSLKNVSLSFLSLTLLLWLICSNHPAFLPLSANIQQFILLCSSPWFDGFLIISVHALFFKGFSLGFDIPVFSQRGQLELNVHFYLISPLHFP